MLDRDCTNVVTRHARRLGVEDIESALANMELFAIKVGIIENNSKLIGKNPTSSAKGLYQFIDGSIAPAVTRLNRMIPRELWMTEVLLNKDASTLSRERQTLLFLADILEKRGSDRYTKSIMEGSRSAMLLAYLVLHHTNPDEATQRRAERIMYREE